MSKSREILATVVEGHGVASGKSNDPRFPGGTLQMQIPFFREFGLDLSRYHTGTLNLSIAPHRFEIISPTHTFRLVKWHPTEPAEDFSFVACRVNQPGCRKKCGGYIYYPHPETKPEHVQPDDVLEVILTEFQDNLSYGDTVELEVDESLVRLI